MAPSPRRILVWTVCSALSYLYFAAILWSMGLQYEMLVGLLLYLVMVLLVITLALNVCVPYHRSRVVRAGPMDDTQPSMKRVQVQEVKEPVKKRKN